MLKGVYKHKPITEETKAKMSLALAGHPCYYSKEYIGEDRYNETKKKISIAQKGNKYRLGTKHSSETKEKIGLATKKRNGGNIKYYFSKEYLGEEKFNQINEIRKTKVSFTLEGNKYGKGNKGKKRTKGTKDKMSLAQIGHPCYSTIGGRRKDLGHFVRSSWEANVARIFLLNNINYEYEKHRFILVDCSYCPDFYLPEFDTYIEVKGYLRDGAKEVLHKFVKAYPNIKLLIIDGEVYKKLLQLYKNKINTWE